MVQAHFGQLIRLLFSFALEIEGTESLITAVSLRQEVGCECFRLAGVRKKIAVCLRRSTAAAGALRVDKAVGAGRLDRPVTFTEWRRGGAGPAVLRLLL